MIEIFQDLPDWTFDVDETSANIYKVIGTSIAGNIVSSQGVEPELLLQKCREEALKIDLKKR